MNASTRFRRRWLFTHRTKLIPRARPPTHPDGERFVVAAAPDNESVVRRDRLVFIFNFFDELRRLVPTN